MKKGLFLIGGFIFTILSVLVIFRQALKKICFNFSFISLGISNINFTSLLPQGQIIDGKILISINNGTRWSFGMRVTRVNIIYKNTLLAYNSQPFDLNMPALTISAIPIDFKTVVTLKTYDAVMQYKVLQNSININYSLVGRIWWIPIIKRGQVNLNPYNTISTQC